MSRPASLYSRTVKTPTDRQLRYMSEQTVPTVCIRELVVLTNDPKDSHGETKKKSVAADRSLAPYNTEKHNLLDPPLSADCKDTEKSFCSEADFLRLIQHVCRLLDIANDHHNGTNYHITRIGTAEFYFYTQAPLNEEQFIRLLDFSKSHAESLQENVHAVLSSFAVWIDDKLCNIALYATCGPKANMHTIIKADPSKIDPDYREADSLFRQPPQDSPSHGVVLSDGRLLINNETLTIQINDTFIQVITVICFDHATEYGYQLLIKHLGNDNFNLHTAMYNYVLTSNSIRRLSIGKKT